MSYLTSYLTTLAVLMMVLSPLVVPAIVTAYHAGKRLLGIEEPARAGLPRLAAATA